MEMSKGPCTQQLGISGFGTTCNCITGSGQVYEYLVFGPSGNCHFRRWGGQNSSASLEALTWGFLTISAAKSLLVTPWA